MKFRVWGIVAVAIVGVGVAFRLFAGIHSLGFVHPDEHQQYLEAANRIAYGYGVSFWEYDRGIRHLLYPGCLASFLLFLDGIGVTSPIMQARVIRCLLGLSVLGSMSAFSVDLYRRGKHIAAFTLLLFAALSPYFVFVGARTLSETATIPILVVVLMCLDRYPWTAGVLAGLMFGVRFQSALFVAPLFVAMAVGCCRSGNARAALRAQCVPFATGCVLALTFVGLVDRLTWGAWFHSPIEYFRANVMEGVAASFGVTPWYQYLLWTADVAFDSSLSLVPFALIGFFVRPRFAFAMLVFAFAHSMIGHKEPRFLWPMLPVLLILIAEGVECLARHATTRNRQMAAVVLSVFFLMMVKSQWDETSWGLGHSESSSRALAHVGRQADLTGVALVGGDAHSGNYFYLRRKVPYLVDLKWAEIEGARDWQRGRVNYLIAPRRPDTSRELTRVGQVNELQIYRVSRVGGDSLR